MTVACGPDEAQNSILNRQQAIEEFNAGHIPQARELLLRSMSWNNADPETLYYMGRVCCIEQKWEEAIGYFDRCLNADPACPTARDWLQFAENSSGLGERLRPGPALPPRPPLPPSATPRVQ